jgi:hypothetical protein
MVRAAQVCRKLIAQLLSGGGTFAGNVGFGGATPPAYPLHVQGTGYVGGVMIGAGVLTNFNTAAFRLVATSDQPTVMEQANGATGEAFQVRAHAGTVVFAVTAAGDPVLRSPNGTRYKLLVANDGTLSTQVV